MRCPDNHVTIMLQFHDERNLDQPEMVVVLPDTATKPPWWWFRTDMGEPWMRKGRGEGNAEG